MAKTLKDFLEGYLKVKSADEQKFIDKHVTAKNPDRNGNGDDVFKGSTKPIDRRKERKGYNPGEDEKVYEELKGNQHKIDANKNGKVDAHDFKLLRKKKKVAEEAEQIDELSTPTLQSYRKKARAQGNAIVDKMKMGGGDWSKDQKDTKTLRKRAAGAQASGKQLVKRGESLKTEEAEQIDELDRQLGGTLSRYINKTKDNEKREAGRNLALSKRWGDTKYGTPEPKVKAVDRFKEEVEELEELSKATLGSYAQKAKTQLSRAEYLSGTKMGQRMHGAKPDAQERKLNQRANKRYAGLETAINKLTKEDIVREAASKYGCKSDKPAKMRKEEKLANMIADLSESHQRTMMSVFEKLNEDNKSKFLEACDTPEGVEQMLDFAINNRGE